VLAVGLVRRGDGGEPALAADAVARDLGDGVADLVVVLDRVLGLGAGARLAAGAGADAQQRGIEVALLGFGVDFEERRQPPPDHAQRIDVGAVDLLEHGEEAALLVVIVEDELGDVHRDVVPVFG
jgi:hypothetical protein